jgi:hypothetical protein
MKSKIGRMGIALILALAIFTVACSVDQVLSDINLLLQTANVIGVAVGAVDPTISAEITLIAGIATTGLSEIKTDYDAWKASGAITDLQKLEAAISVLKTNLPAELAAAHISNPATVAIVTAWVNLVTSTLNDILAILPNLSKGAKGAGISTLPTPQSLQARWQNEVCKGDVKCGSLVKARMVRK